MRSVGVSDHGVAALEVQRAVGLRLRQDHRDLPGVGHGSNHSGPGVGRHQSLYAPIRQHLGRQCPAYARAAVTRAAAHTVRDTGGEVRQPFGWQVGHVGFGR